jgi:hypothetical protein
MEMEANEPAKDPLGEDGLGDGVALQLLKRSEILIF